MTAQTDQSPVESQVDHLFLAFTNTDIQSREDFDLWSAQLDALSGADTVWGERFFADPDQRPGQSPTWRFMATFGLKGGERAAREALAKLVRASKDEGADFTVWAYDAVGEFVRQSDGLLGSRSKTILAPGAYRKTERNGSER